MEDSQESNAVSEPGESRITASPPVGNEPPNWSDESVLMLIDLYKTYRYKVGNKEVRSMKTLWEIICYRINDSHNKHFTPAQCANKWRVLERNYKKVRDNDNSSPSGRGRKAFEYEEELDEIFKKKRNAHPELLASDTPETTPLTTSIKNLSGENPEENLSAPSMSSDATTRKKGKLLSRSFTLEQMRQDRKEYYSEYLKIQREKLQIEREKLKERRRKNDLIAERNDIFKNIWNFKNSFL